ncbi:hypothetical protein V493_05813 [Pseudogymnoascus sp. VKM F-4281 (FW-2241)]|nr:hypothetical protein V493_05813 [Pseudogymnoascus sp. VKM F-4281 (FW-2241)]
MPLGFTRHSNRSQQLAPPPPTPQVLSPQLQQQLQTPPPQLSQADQLQQQAHLQQQHLQQQQQQHIPQQSPTALASAPENKGYDQGVVAQPQQPQQIQQQQQQQQSPYPSSADDVASYQAPPADQQSGGNAYHELTAHPSAAPTRSRSHRFSTSYLHISSPAPPPQQQQQQQQQQQGAPQNGADPAPFAAANAKVPAPGELKKSSTTGPAAPVLSAEPHKKSKSRNFFGQFSSKSHREPSSSSSSRQQQQQQQQQQAPTLKSPAAGRKISKKNNDSLPEPPQQHQNNSVERLQQQSGWQSNQSSGTLPSPQEQQEDDGLDPYLIREKEADHQGPAYDPRLGLTVRVVADGQVAPQQYHQQFQEQQVHSPAQYSPAQYQLASQLNAPVAEDPSAQQPGQYQQQHAPQQSLGNFVSPQQYRNPEVVSQLSHDSPLDPPEDPQRPPSVQSSQGYSSQQQQQYPSRTASANQDPPRLTHQSSSSMAPPAQQGSQSRKSTDKSLQQQQQGDNRAPPPGYTQNAQFPPQSQSTPTSAQSPLPPIPSTQQQQQQQQQQQPPTNYRNSQLRGEYGPDGRSTPPLQETRELSEMDKLLIKYKKVKGLYFEKQAQVEQLQNTLANQRLSQSKTSLDDSEYLTRFQRLDGAIKEVAFSIRKDWKVLPHWLLPVVNPSALQTGTKEMTAVGRATISRWLNDEIFGKCFHPSLDLGFSAELKRVEQNVRFFAAPPPNQDEADALTAKITQWRLTTMEGLAYRLNSAHAAQAKADFVQMAVSNLTAHLMNHLHDSADHGFQGNATSIVELAVGIASHLPCESRDIAICYPLPGDMVTSYMKIEPALPPLEVDSKAEEADGKEGGKEEEGGKEGGKGKKDGKGQLKKLAPGAAAAAAAAAAEQQQQTEIKEGANNIRFAGFMGVEVRGRQWLYNPPVWTIS